MNAQLATTKTTPIWHPWDEEKKTLCQESHEENEVLQFCFLEELIGQSMKEKSSTSWEEKKPQDLIWPLRPRKKRINCKQKRSEGREKCGI